MFKSPTAQRAAVANLDRVWGKAPELIRKASEGEDAAGQERGAARVQGSSPPRALTLPPQPPGLRAPAVGSRVACRALSWPDAGVHVCVSPALPGAPVRSASRFASVAVAGGDSRPWGSPPARQLPPHNQSGLWSSCRVAPCEFIRNETEKGVTCRAHAVPSVARLQAEGRKGPLIIMEKLFLGLP